MMKNGFFLSLLIASSLLGCDLAAREQAYNDESFEQFFQADRVHHLKVVFSLEEWQALTNDMWHTARDWGSLGRGSDYGTNNFFFTASFYRQARFIDMDSGRIMDNIGIKVRGSTSRFVPQYTDGSFKWAHFKISFAEQFEGNEDVYGSPAIPTIQKNKRKLYGVRGFALKYTRGDSTWVREPYSYKLLRDFGIPAPRTTYANLQLEITGYTNVNYGLFEVVESIDKTFCERVFGQESYLYKCLITANGPASLRLTKFYGWDDDYDKNVSIGVEKMDPANLTEAASWDINDWPTDPTRLQVYRPRYDIVWKDSVDNARSALDDFIMNLHAHNGSFFEDWIESAFDVDGFLKVLAVDTLLGQWDSYFMNFNNYYLYYHPREQRFVYIPYDYDGCMLDQGIMDVSSGNIPITNRSVTNWTSTNAILINKILAVQKYRQQYYDNVRRLISEPGLYNWPDMRATMEELQALIEPYATDPTVVHDEPAGYADIDSWNFQSFVRARMMVVSNELLN